MSSVGSPGSRKPARRSWRLRAGASRSRANTAPGSASVGEWIAERLRQSELKAVIDPDIERNEPRDPGSGRPKK